MASAFLTSTNFISILTKRPHKKGRRAEGREESRGGGTDGQMDRKGEGEGENSRVYMKISIISSCHNPNSLVTFKMCVPSILVFATRSHYIT